MSSVAATQFPGGAAAAEGSWWRPSWAAVPHVSKRCAGLWAAGAELVRVDPSSSSVACPECADGHPAGARAFLLLSFGLQDLERAFGAVRLLTETLGGCPVPPAGGQPDGQADAGMLSVGCGSRMPSVVGGRCGSQLDGGSGVRLLCVVCEDTVGQLWCQLWKLRAALVRWTSHLPVPDNHWSSSLDTGTLRCDADRMYWWVRTQLQAALPVSAAVSAAALGEQRFVQWRERAGGPAAFPSPWRADPFASGAPLGLARQFADAASVFVEQLSDTGGVAAAAVRTEQLLDRRWWGRFGWVRRRVRRHVHNVLGQLGKLVEGAPACSVWNKDPDVAAESPVVVWPTSFARQLSPVAAEILVRADDVQVGVPPVLLVAVPPSQGWQLRREVVQLVGVVDRQDDDVSAVVQAASAMVSSSDTNQLGTAQMRRLVAATRTALRP